EQQRQPAQNSNRQIVQDRRREGNAPRLQDHIARVTRDEQHQPRQQRRFQSSKRKPAWQILESAHEDTSLTCEPTTFTRGGRPRRPSSAVFARYHTTELPPRMLQPKK